jgi:hypothetical protein
MNVMERPSGRRYFGTTPTRLVVMGVLVGLSTATGGSAVSMLFGDHVTLGQAVFVGGFSAGVRPLWMVAADWVRRRFASGDQPTQ